MEGSHRGVTWCGDTSGRGTRVVRGHELYHDSSGTEKTRARTLVVRETKLHGAMGEMVTAALGVQCWGRTTTKVNSADLFQSHRLHLPHTTSSSLPTQPPRLVLAPPPPSPARRLHPRVPPAPEPPNHHLHPWYPPDPPRLPLAYRLRLLLPSAATRQLLQPRRRGSVGQADAGARVRGVCRAGRGYRELCVEVARGEACGVQRWVRATDDG
jgi:hypothetical protein